MAAAVEAPIPYPESPTDPDEAAYPCKGCGEILEEGKAFELAGNRWHIDCFRCNTCDTLLDSDANLLLLGDGSLICNNCTYSCSSCGNKIEDLAILTGDQAFCANCFKCRNCKRKIENLRYARTSQGIFCMDCHEALMAKRRKKTSRNTTTRSKLSANNTVLLDKSLPAIPPPEARATTYLSNEEPSYPSGFSSATTEVPSVSRTVSELRELDSGPIILDQAQTRDALTLPSTTFRDKKRQSYMSQRSDMSGNDEFLIPVAFDPTPPVQSPNTSSQLNARSADDKSRDYFLRQGMSPVPAQSSQPRTVSPHIAYQEKGRLPSQNLVDQMLQRKDESGSRSNSAVASPYVPAERMRQLSEDSTTLSQTPYTDAVSGDNFRLHDAPKPRREMQSGKGLDSDSSTARADALADLPQFRQVSPVANTDIGLEETYSTPHQSRDTSPVAGNLHESPKPRLHPTMSALASLPKRGDSLDGTKRSQSIPRKQLNANATIPSGFSDVLSSSTSNTKLASLQTDMAKVNGGKTISAPIESPQSRSLYDSTISSQTQPKVSSPGAVMTESFIDPRAPPLPPQNRRTGSVNTLDSPAPRSPALPRYSAGGDFTLDEDMVRILGAEEMNNQESFLRRVSNSVRHGRSYSDKGAKLTKDRWPRSPIMGASIGQEISSPSSPRFENREDVMWFKNELRRERQRVVEKEKRITELESQLDSAANIKQVNTELREKRSTIVVLDTQKEIVVRELEVLSKHIAAAKSTGEPLDVQKMSNSAVREFAESLQRLKDSFAPIIEDSIQKRNDLIDEIANLTQMKEKSFLEFEQLSLKNAQLADLNNQLVHQIQELYKANSGGGGSTDSSKQNVNGLGIYSHHKDKSTVSIESREITRPLMSEISIPDSGTTLQATEAEPVTVIQGPQVVNIRKGQPKKFDWRKGQKVAKGVTKGLKGAFSSTQQSYSREMQFAETGAYGANPLGQEYSTITKQGPEPSKQGGFGFFGGNQKVPGKPNGLYASQSNTSTPSLVLDASTNLYGVDLEQRAEYEKTSVPFIVKRCIEEVESRGMDVEGIYRKSGGNSQVQQVRDGFEKPSPDFDISDDDLDIHAVTSGLKQYFRRLPNPLITYEVYDRLLETTSITDAEVRTEAMRTATASLPKVHLDTLEYLIVHLAKVVLNEKENLMTSTNIAVVFAPTIMRPESLAREMSDTKMKNDVVKWLVENHEKVFKA